MSGEKSKISERDANAIIIMSFGLAILLFYINLDFSARHYAITRKNAYKKNTSAMKTLPPFYKRTGKKAGEQGADSFPSYPWSGESDVAADIAMAKKSISGEIPSERTVPIEEANAILQRKILLPKGKLYLWQLRNFIESKAGIKVYIDMQTWSRQAVSECVGGETKLGIIFKDFLADPKTHLVLIRNGNGETCIIIVCEDKQSNPM